MKQQNTLRMFIIIIFIIFIAVNITGINNFLSFQNDDTLDFGHSSLIIPQGWNTTEEINMTADAKTTSALSNGYVVVDYWDDWPEDTITDISESEFKEMENGEYKVLKNDNLTVSGIEVSKQIFSNPSRNNDEVWNHIGINYVFSKEDANYTIQVHYFTTQDYKNATFLKEIDNSIEDDINNIHNSDYNGFVSSVRSVYHYITGSIQQ